MRAYLFIVRINIYAFYFIYLISFTPSNCSVLNSDHSYFLALTNCVNAPISHYGIFIYTFLLYMFYLCLLYKDLTTSKVLLNYIYPSIMLLSILSMCYFYCS